jgi:hypothetical protein
MMVMYAAKIEADERCIVMEEQVVSFDGAKGAAAIL